MARIFDLIFEYGVVPMVDGSIETTASEVGEAIVKGGYPVVAFDLHGAQSASLAQSLKGVKDLGFGVSQVANAEDAVKAKELGAQFALTAKLDESLIAKCQELELPVCPSVSTEDELNLALKHELKVVNFVVGSCCAQDGEKGAGCCPVAKLKAFAAKAPEVQFMVSGALKLEDIGAFLDEKCVLAVSGDFALPQDLITSKDYEGLIQHLRKVNDVVMDFSVGHVGINANTLENAQKVTNRISELFDTKNTETPIAFFSGRLVEVMKIPFVGDHGHICVDTRNLKRGMAMLTRKGVEFDEKNYIYDAKGNLMTAYLKEVVGGFAFHIRARPR